MKLDITDDQIANQKRKYKPILLPDYQAPINSSLIQLTSASSPFSIKTLTHSSAVGWEVGAIWVYASIYVTLHIFLFYSFQSLLYIYIFFFPDRLVPL